MGRPLLLFHIAPHWPNGALPLHHHLVGPGHPFAGPRARRRRRQPEKEGGGFSNDWKNFPPVFQ